MVPGLSLLKLTLGCQTKGRGSVGSLGGWGTPWVCSKSLGGGSKMLGEGREHGGIQGLGGGQWVKVTAPD